jgi:RNA polymerase sigma-70 factor (ECF subfamily)
MNTPGNPGNPRCSRHEIDTELIHRSLAGDREAARDLHVEYAPVAIAFLRRLGTLPAEIEDASQEVFLRFFRHLADFRGEAELKTWLFRLCATEARRIRRKRRLAALVVGVLQREPTTRAVPPAIWSDTTIQKMIARALDRMPAAQRDAFIRFEVQGMTGKEIARASGSSLPATFRRLYEAQRVVRETLGVERN